MEAALLLHLYPKSKIEIVVWILANDGGRLCAAINATTLALVDTGIPTKDLVCACSAGGSGDSILVDLNRREESSQEGQDNQQGTFHVPCCHSEEL
jgi:exosome complex component RRP41